MFSDYECTLEELEGEPAVRLGMRLVSGLRCANAQRIVEERTKAPFDSAQELARRARFDVHEMKQLAVADALAMLVRTPARPGLGSRSNASRTGATARCASARRCAEARRSARRRRSALGLFIYRSYLVSCLSLIPAKR